jgi:hypothetical protein
MNSWLKIAARTPGPGAYSRRNRRAAGDAHGHAQHESAFGDTCQF